MTQKMRIVLASIGIASLIAAGAVTAQDAAATPAPDTSAQSAQTMRDRLAGRVRESGMAALVQEYTGLDAAGLRAALRSRSTLTELILANGRTVEDFTAAATALFEANQAERLTAFQQRLTQILNGEYREAFGGWRGEMRDRRGAPPNAEPGTGT